MKKIVNIRGNKKSFQLCFHLCRIVRAKIDRCKRGFVHIYIRSTKYLLIDNRMGQRVRWTLTSLTGYILSHPIHIFNILCSKLTRYHVVEFAWYDSVFNLVSSAMATHHRLAKYQENQISNSARGRDRIIIRESA